jgi:hypothetical protein
LRKQVKWYSIFALAWMGCGLASADDRDIKQLLDGVDQIAAPGVPGPLCVFGEDAFAVVTGTARKRFMEPVVAAARMGKGRAVVFGHNGYFDADALGTADTWRFMENAFRWVAGGAQSKPQVAVYKHPALLTFLKEKKMSVAEIDELGPGLSRFKVLCVKAAELSSQREVDAVSDFVRKGGGLVTVGLGWDWL